MIDWLIDRWMNFIEGSRVDITGGCCPLLILTTGVSLRGTHVQYYRCGNIALPQTTSLKASNANAIEIKSAKISSVDLKHTHIHKYKFIPDCSKSRFSPQPVYHHLRLCGFGSGWQIWRINIQILQRYTHLYTLISTLKFVSKTKTNCNLVPNQYW